MAYQVDYTDPLTGVQLPEAYFRVRNVMVDHGAKLAVIQLDIYATKALRDGGQQPFRSMPITISDQPGQPPIFSQSFGAAFPPASPPAPALPQPANTASDILTTQAYLALKTHPQMVAILAAAVAV